MASRRTTLGPLSQNSRAPGRQSLAPASVSRLDRRASAAPSTFSSGRLSSMSSRRQSAVPARGGGRASASMSFGGRRTDSRPLSDRAYRAACTKDIVQFVLDNGYGMPISPKILTNPSSRDFQNILLFLLRCIEPAFEFKKRFEEELPVSLKALGYPFTVSKSALTAVGSPHSWPALLGVLIWLLENIKYKIAKAEVDDAVEAAALSGNASDDVEMLHPSLSPNSEFHPRCVKNIEESYGEFLAGEDQHPVLDAKYRAEDEALNAGLAERSATLELRIAERTESLAAKKAQPPPLVQLAARKKTLIENTAKYKMLLPSQREHKAGVDRKLADKVAEAESWKAKIQALKKEVDKMREVHSQQESKGIDAERITKDRALAKEALTKLSEELATADQKLARAEEALAETVTSCGDLQRQYANKLSRIPASTLNACGVDLSLEFDAKTLALSNDVESKIVPALRTMKESFNKQLAALENEMLNLQEKLYVREERSMQEGKRNLTLQARYAHEDSSYQAEKALMAKEIQANSEKDLNKSIEQAEQRMQAKESGRVSDRRVEIILQQLHQLKGEFAVERTRLSRVIMHHVEKIRKHTVSIVADNKAVARYFADERAKVEEKVEAEGDKTIENVSNAQ